MERRKLFSPLIIALVLFILTAISFYVSMFTSFSLPYPFYILFSPFNFIALLISHFIVFLIKDKDIKFSRLAFAAAFFIYAFSPYGGYMLEGTKIGGFLMPILFPQGWGKLERKDLDLEKAHALVTVTSSPIAAECAKAKAPVDTFLRAFLTGVFSIYFKKDVDCVETKCSAQNSQSCDFVIKPLAEFNFENAATRNQLRVE